MKKNPKEKDKQEKQDKPPATQPPPRRTPIGNPLVAAVLGFLVFGWGHWYLGKKWKAVVLFASLSVCFISGVILSERVFFPTVTTDYPLWLGALGALGQVWAGIFYLGALLFQGPGGNIHLLTHEVGWVASISAALLNLLAMVDAWDIALGKKS